MFCNKNKLASTLQLEQNGVNVAQKMQYLYLYRPALMSGVRKHGCRLNFDSGTLFGSQCSLKVSNEVKPTENRSLWEESSFTVGSAHFILQIYSAHVEELDYEFVNVSGALPRDVRFGDDEQELSTELQKQDQLSQRMSFSILKPFYLFYEHAPDCNLYKRLPQCTRTTQSSRKVRQWYRSAECTGM